MSESPPSGYGRLVETRLRVLTWNVWWRFGPWEARQPAIAAVIEQVGADLVCLQECWSEQVDSLGAALGYHVAYASDIELDGVPFGNAVLSRWPMTGSERCSLPAPAGLDERRLVLRADVDGPRGPVQVFSTHLNWRFDQSAVRQAQVRAVCEFVHASRPPGGRSFPPVLAGDFNADPDSDEIRLLTGRSAPPVDKLVFHDAWEVARTTADPGWTWSNDNPYAAGDLEPDRRIDYVFVGWPKAGGAGHVVDCALVGTTPVDGVVPSDHYGVVAELRY